MPFVVVTIIIFILFYSQVYKRKQILILKRERKRRKGLSKMTNEIIEKFIEKKCKISSGSWVDTSTGKIISVNENWIEIETKKGRELINADFITNIKEVK